jgi:4-amino-4-deoxy-L-arabinose transferase-like glycosyltransferase
MTQQAMRVSAPGLLDASDKIMALTQNASVTRAHKARASDRSANGLYILGAITLGIPALLLIPLIGMNPGIQEGTLAVITKLLVFSAVLVAMVFEIKRLADEPSDADSHG